MTPKELKVATQKAKDFLNSRALIILKNKGLAHFKDSFAASKQGFTDANLVKWTDIKESTKEKKRRKNGSLSPILTDSGNLMDSIVASTDYNQMQVTYSSDEPYSEIHNEGGKVSGTFRVKAHTRKGKPVKAHNKTVNTTIPKRQYMGPSKELERKVVDEIEKALDNIFK